MNKSIKRSFLIKDEDEDTLKNGRRNTMYFFEEDRMDNHNNFEKKRKKRYNTLKRKKEFVPPLTSLEIEIFLKKLNEKN